MTQRERVEQAEREVIAKARAWYGKRVAFEAVTGRVMERTKRRPVPGFSHWTNEEQTEHNKLLLQILSASQGMEAALAALEAEIAATCETCSGTGVERPARIWPTPLPCPSGCGAGRKKETTDA